MASVTTTGLQESQLYFTPHERAALNSLIQSDRKIWRPRAGPQVMAYESKADEIFYGGAAGGGKAGLLHRKGAEVKVLGTGDLKKALTVVAHQFTAGARKKIEAAGGRCEEVPA